MSRRNKTIDDRIPLGISRISTYQPAWELPNEWYESRISRKFVKHTGILSRHISNIDEISQAHRCIEELLASSDLNPADCAGLVFVSPSFVPVSIARQYLDPAAARAEQLSRAAHELAGRLSIEPRHVSGMNGFCSGYAKALAHVRNRFADPKSLGKEQFILVVTSSRISRITDFSDTQSGALFGDFATATVIARCDSRNYPVHLQIVDANYERQAAKQAYFDFSLKQNVLAPAPDGGKQIVPERVVFSLDGMGIADTAPRAMAAAAANMVDANSMSPSDIECIVPHQAGAGIVRLTSMKLEQAGFAVDPVNGMTKNIGNISSGSVPFTLKQLWYQLNGNILCPVAAVGAPGKPEVSQGCILLRKLPGQHALPHAA